MLLKARSKLKVTRCPMLAMRRSAGFSGSTLRAGKLHTVLLPKALQTALYDPRRVPFLLHLLFLQLCCKFILFFSVLSKAFDGEDDSKRHHFGLPSWNEDVLGYIILKKLLTQNDVVSALKTQNDVILAQEAWHDVSSSEAVLSLSHPLKPNFSAFSTKKTLKHPNP